jgi:hypothetical protein
MMTDLWFDLILAVMLSTIIAQNMGLRDRLKDIAEKLDRQK